MIPASWRPVLLAGLLSAAIPWLAVPVGSAGAGGRVVARVIAFGLLAVAAAVYQGRPRAGRLGLALGALAALAGLGIVQSLVWPQGAVEWLSPRHGELASDARDLLGPVAEVAQSGAALSLAPELSRSAALAIAAAGAFLFAGFVSGTSRWGRRLLALALVGSAVFQTVYGLRDWLAGTAPRLRGTFVNPNHLAYSLEIALAVAFAWAAWGLYAQRYASRLERKLALVAPPIGAWLLLAAGLVWTGSRAGLAAAAAGLLLQFVLLLPALEGTRPSLVPKALAGVALALLALVAARGAGRLGETTLYEVAWGDRSAVWRQTLDLWRDFPLTGTGLGTFGEAFPLVQPAETTQLFWRRAHNDALELLLTGGVLGLALGAVALVGVSRPLARVLRLGFRTEDRTAALAALGALVSVAVHELWDFGLTLPGIALPFVALLGAAAAARVKNHSLEAVPGRGATAGARTARSRAGER